MCNEIKRDKTKEQRQLPEQEWTVKNISGRTFYLKFPNNFMRRHILLPSKSGVNNQTKLENKGKKKYLLSLGAEDIKSFGYASKAEANNELKPRYNQGSKKPQTIIDCATTDINIVMTALATKLAEVDGDGWQQGLEREVCFKFEQSCVKDLTPSGTSPSTFATKTSAGQTIRIKVTKSGMDTFEFLHVQGS